VRAKIQVTPSDYKRLSDEELVHRYINRQDQTAISCLFERYGHLIFGICLKYFPNGEAAKTAVQDLFIKMVEEIPNFRIGDFKSWIYRTTREFCEMRKNNKLNVVNNRITLQDDFGFRDEKKPFSADQFSEEQLESAINRLSKEEKQCIDLFYNENLTYIEISKRMQLPLNEVRKHLQKSRQHLETIFETLSRV
jgi:RNA polymerase sigma-70 factor, ECF subfamily